MMVERTSRIFPYMTGVRPLRLPLFTLFAPSSITLPLEARNAADAPQRGTENGCEYQASRSHLAL